MDISALNKNLNINQKQQTAELQQVKASADAASQPQAKPAQTEQVISDGARLQIMLRDALANAGFKVTPENMKMLGTMLENEMPLSKEAIIKMNQALKSTGDAQKAMFFIKNGMTPTASNNDTLNKLINREIQLPAQIERLAGLVAEMPDSPVKDDMIRLLLGGETSAESNAQIDTLVNENQGRTAVFTEEGSATPGNLSLPEGVDDNGMGTGTDFDAAKPDGQVKNAPEQAGAADLADIKGSAETGTGIGMGTDLQPETNDILPGVRDSADLQGKIAQPDKLAEQIDNTVGESNADGLGLSENADSPSSLGRREEILKAAVGEKPELTGAAESRESGVPTESKEPAESTARNLRGENDTQSAERARVKENGGEIEWKKVWKGEGERVGVGENSGEKVSASNVKEAIIKKFSLNSPAEKEEIDQMLNDLRKNVSIAKQALPAGENNTEQGRRLSETLDNIQKNIDFANQMKNSIFIQIPIFVGQKKTDADLYVFKDKRKKSAKSGGGSASALLALDMAELGHVEAYLRKDRTSVKCQFRLSGGIEPLFISNIAKLSELLDVHGYRLDAVSYRKTDEPFTLIDAEPEMDGAADGIGENMGKNTEKWHKFFLDMQV